MNKYIVGFAFITTITLLAVNPSFGEEPSFEKNQQIPTIQNTGPDYVIGNGDILFVETWKEEDFTRDNVFVRMDGKITFPLLDDIQATGHSTMEIKHIIQKGLEEFIESPTVTVTLKAPTSQKYYILGEIAKTGEYDLIKDITVLQAFALAGGFTEWASKKEIILFRRVDEQEKIIKINYKNIVKGKDFDMNVMIKANDTIIVP